MNLCQAIDNFILACEADGLAPATTQHYQSKLGRLGRELGHCQLRDINTNTLRYYIIEMRQQTERYIDAPQKPIQQGGYSPETVNTHIRALHRFFKWCALEYDRPNPMAKIRYPQPQQQAPKGISPNDVIKMLEATGDNITGVRDRALVAFLADTGCRLGGLVGLSIHDLYLAKHQALVLEKGNQARMVMFTYFTQQLLAQWLEWRPEGVEQIFSSMTTGPPFVTGLAAHPSPIDSRDGCRCDP